MRLAHEAIHQIKRDMVKGAARARANGGGRSSRARARTWAHLREEVMIYSRPAEAHSLCCAAPLGGRLTPGPEPIGDRHPGGKITQFHCVLRTNVAHQQPIERMLVQRRQADDFKRVRGFDGKRLVTHVKQPAAQHPRIDLKFTATQSTFDTDLPETGYTENQRILPVRYPLSGCGGQGRGNSRGCQ
ncbi:hypothetical protein PSP31121_05541 [Pandoraea sputorum]|uniref:Uncharacterized protein n=1 Tax=Pandoraea sputorum TaxID=93222 RepID=A0A5E5BKM0_9BURK|nr:hypothetical protein PSP31121_05541 [Pandoraea sputorum]